MSRLRLFEPDMSDSFGSLFRQAVAPWRLDDNFFFRKPRRLEPATVNDPFETMLRKMVGAWGISDEMFEGGMTVNVDVVEKDGMYQVCADLPGVKKEDINVRIDGNVVRIDAQTQDAREVKENGKVVRNERHYGSISRTFSLAQDVDESKASGRYQDGVLTLELPKRSGSESEIRRIEIQ